MTADSEMQEIYWDNSATTPVCPEAVAAACAAMTEEYGNPSSLYRKGVAASRRLTNARATLAGFLGAKEEEVFFTSGGSESNNTAVLGAARARRRFARRVLVAAVEHHSVPEPALFLGQEGFVTEKIPVDGDGRVKVDRLAAMLNEDVAVVGVQQVNNENGAVQPLAEVGALVRRHCPRACFHVDGVQGLGKLPLDLAGWQADSYSASGHKLHGPKGVGLLWVRRDCRILPLIQGGGQEKNFRSGTENVPGIAAFAAAAAVYCPRQAENARKMGEMRRRLAQLLLDRLPDCLLNSDLEHGAPHILNLSFLGVKSEVLLHTLEGEGIYVSSGSACHSHKKGGSPVLTAMGLAPARIDSALRFSFSPHNTLAEVERGGAVVIRAVTELRGL